MFLFPGEMYQGRNFDCQFWEGARGLQVETQRSAGEYCAQVINWSDRQFRIYIKLRMMHTS